MVLASCPSPSASAGTDPRHAVAYSPLWDTQLGLWIPKVVKEGLNTRQVSVRRCQRRRSLRADRMTTLHNAHPVVYILWSVCKWLVTRMAGSKVTDRTSIDIWVRSALAGLGAYAEERFRRV